jgi:thiamine pyrophosphate-dependent acetolactate synthase large subunit-like protein
MSAAAPAAAREGQAGVRCSQQLFRTIAELGCEVFFNVPGRGVYPLLDDLAEFEQIRYVTALHESALITMADGYSRASGRRPAFVNLYMSSGVLNASSGVFLAQRDRIPLVITATQTESWAVGAGARAEAESIVEIMRPLTKWACEVPRADRVAEVLRRATTIAATPPMGPVFVAIPVDFHGQLVADEPAGTLPVRPTFSPDPGALSGVAELVSRAGRPVLVVGAEALSAGAGEPARRLARTHGLALLAEPDPPALPAADGDPSYGGVFIEAEELLTDCDLIISLGVNTYEPWHRRLAGVEGTAHVQLASSAGELGKVFQAAVSHHGDLRWLGEGLEAALAVGAQVDRTAWRERVAAYRRSERERFDERAREGWDGTPLSAARVFTTLAERLPDDALIVEQSATMTGYVRAYMRFADGERYVAASGSCQGWGLGAAIGAQLAQPGRTVVAVLGDGGFMFAVQALWSAVQHELPVVVLVNNNGGWLSMRNSLRRGSPHLLEARGQLGYGWDIALAALARSFGAGAATVQAPDQLADAIDQAVRSEGPFLLDVHTRHEAKLSPSPLVGY